jgi:hypothetical protein
MQEQPEAKHERLHRNRVLKGATIIRGITNSEISCVIRNMHKDGAELRLAAADSVIPQQFLLYVPADGLAYSCGIRWRLGSRVGVELYGTEPKPRHHYG